MVKTNYASSALYSRGISGFLPISSINGIVPSLHNKPLRVNDKVKPFSEGMKRKCFHPIRDANGDQQGWLILKPKKPKQDSIDKYGSINQHSGVEDVTCYPSTVNDSGYAHFVNKSLREQMQELKKEEITPKFSPLNSMFIFHGNTFRGRFAVVSLGKQGVYMQLGVNVSVDPLTALVRAAGL